MARETTARWRWFGALVLLSALAMLILGQTALKPHLDGKGFFLYWLACLVLTMTAMVVAILDASALRRRSRQQHRELLQDALDEIEAQARARHLRAPRNKQG